MAETSAAVADREERLAEHLLLLTDRLRRGERPSLEAECRAFPEFAADLRELWPTILLAEELGPPIASSRPLPPVTPKPDAQPLPASFGDYEIREELGRGGMGVVYRAWQRSAGRPVALKMMLAADLAGPESLKRFRAEAAAVGRLDHPNLVPLYEWGEHQGRPYYTMKYIAGQTLNHLVAKGPLPPRRAAELMAKVADAIDHAHAKGIFHRDLKPSNVLVDTHGEPHVTDFGLAKDMLPPQAGADDLTAPPHRSLTQTGAIIGTPGYMPPEQAGRNRGSLSPASDVYSLGAILYQLVTGRPPFMAGTAVDTLMMVLEQDPIPPRMLNPRIEKDLEIIILKCLQKPPELRYPSAALLAADLRAYVAGESIASGPHSLLYFFSRMLRSTHHVAVLENWGLLWMWHAVVVFILCCVTNWMKWEGVSSHLAYMALWSIGLGIWAAIFWNVRKRGGPITFVERQIAHAWAGAVIGSIFLFIVEWLMNLPVLTLSPVLAILAGMVFIVKAGTLSGIFYVTAIEMFITAVAMSLAPKVDVFLFGVVSAIAFFWPGYSFYRRRLVRAEEAHE